MKAVRPSTKSLLSKQASASAWQAASSSPDRRAVSASMPARAARRVKGRAAGDLSGKAPGLRLQRAGSCDDIEEAETFGLLHADAAGGEEQHLGARGTEQPHNVGDRGRRIADAEPRGGNAEAG